MFESSEKYWFASDRLTRKRSHLGKVANNHRVTIEKCHFDPGEQSKWRRLELNGVLFSFGVRSWWQTVCSAKFVGSSQFDSPSTASQWHCATAEIMQWRIIFHRVQHRSKLWFMDSFRSVLTSFDCQHHWKAPFVIQFVSFHQIISLITVAFGRWRWKTRRTNSASQTKSITNPST